jgi:UDP-N-acetylglucosamine 3-dehydrogenase
MTQAANGTPTIGIIGLGRVSQPHIDAWKAAGVTSFAFADVSAEAVEAAIQAHGGTGYTDPMELIRSGTVDIVCICSPPVFHREQAIAAVEHGIATICEKPLAASLEDAQAIAELGQVLQFRSRFGGFSQRAPSMWLSDPAIAGGGVLATMSSHSVDLFRHLIGEPIELNALFSNHANDHSPELQVEHTFALTLKSTQGTIGIIDSTWFAPRSVDLTVYGTRRMVEVDYTNGGLRVHDLDGTSGVVRVDPHAPRIHRQNAHFLECWQGKSFPRVTINDGVRSQEILDAFYHHWHREAAVSSPD